MPPLLLLVFTLALLYYIAKHIKLRLKLFSIPGPSPLPILGNSLDLIKGGNAEFLNNLGVFRTKFGSRFCMWIGPHPYVVFTNPNDIEKILSSQQHIDKSRDYDYILAWLGYGLLNSTGSLWHSRRKILTPAFHFAILEDFLHIMNKQGDILVDILKEQGPQEFNIFPFVTRAALDIICETAMGRKIEAQRQSSTPYVKAVYRMSELFAHRQIRPWLQPNIIWSWSPSGREERKMLKILHSFTDSVIQKSKKAREEGERIDGKKPALLELLLDYQSKNPTELDDLSIRQEVDTFMFEGHDTTAANLNWTLYLLGSHPHVQAKVHQELDRVLGDESNITSAQLTQLKYLENCIKESLRIFPSVPFIGRKLSGELKLDEQTTLPPETTILILIYYAHRNPTVFKDPEIFIPERFDDMEKNPFSYVPFSAGNRNCIGQKFAMMEEKVVLAKILRNFKIESMQKREDLTLLAEIILRPEEGIRVRLTKRD